MLFRALAGSDGPPLFGERLRYVRQNVKETPSSELKSAETALKLECPRGVWTAFLNVNAVVKLTACYELVK